MRLEFSVARDMSTCTVRGHDGRLIELSRGRTEQTIDVSSYVLFSIIETRADGHPAPPRALTYNNIPVHIRRIGIAIRSFFIYIVNWNIYNRILLALVLPLFYVYVYIYRTVYPPSIFASAPITTVIRDNGNLSLLYTLNSIMNNYLFSISLILIDSIYM